MIYLALKAPTQLSKHLEYALNTQKNLLSTQNIHLALIEFT